MCFSHYSEGFWGEEVYRFYSMEGKTCPLDGVFLEIILFGANFATNFFQYYHKEYSVKIVQNQNPCFTELIFNEWLQGYTHLMILLTEGTEH